MVVGLGNPGQRYARTRHNAGFEVVDRLAERWGIDRAGKAQSGALVATGSVAGERAIVVRPQGYMNRSGQPVAALAHHHGLTVERIIVAHDDLDLPFGSVRCKRGGGSGGHKGLQNVDQHIGQDYLRVRLGVGRPPAGLDGADYVLGRWTEEESGALGDVVERACDAIEVLMREGLDAAMNRFNVRPRPPRAEGQGKDDLADGARTGGAAQGKDLSEAASRGLQEQQT